MDDRTSSDSGRLRSATTSTDQGLSLLGCPSDMRAVSGASVQIRSAEVRRCQEGLADDRLHSVRGIVEQKIIELFD